MLRTLEPLQLDPRLLRRAPGIAVARVSDGQISLAAAGTASVLTEEAMTPETACLWFSMTKIVTATAAVALSEEGRLELDAPVSSYLEGFPRQVTVRHLLQHTAGLANPLPLRWVRPAAEEHPADFVGQLLRRYPKADARPGRVARYTNLGYLAVGEVIAAAAGTSYESVVHTRILEPLGMHATAFRPLPGDQTATGHQRRLHPFNPLLRLAAPRGIVGAPRGPWLTLRPFVVNGAAYGGLVGPVSDAARFLAMHACDGELDGLRVISAEGARSMRRLDAHGRKLDVGLGWFRRRSDGGDFVEHLGGGAGFWNVMRLYPESGEGVVAMGNSTSWDHQRVARLL